MTPATTLVNLADALRRQLAEAKVRGIELTPRMDEARTALASVRMSIGDVQRALKERELEMADLVEGETIPDPTNPQGGPAGPVSGTARRAFTNDQARKAEVRRRLAADSEYQGWTRELSSLEVRRVGLETDFARLEDTARSTRSFIDATVAEVQLLVLLKSFHDVGVP